MSFVQAPTRDAEGDFTMIIISAFFISCYFHSYIFAKGITIENVLTCLESKINVGHKRNK